ncbi:glycosyltransferase family 9 protein [Kangiella sp.]|uniref:glycosyltransferase family 9 protein n=1 Tax=Kangiella sp. TaxID=1920245 RepID=UPI003A9453CD
MLENFPQSPQAICILRLSAIGDVCHAVSTVQAIQRQYPEALITWVIGKVEAQLLKHLPDVEFIIFDKSKGVKAYAELRKAMKGRQYDILLHMQLAFRANLAAYFIPATIKLGFEKKRSKELHSLFVNEHITDSKGMHVLEGFRDFARAIGVPDSKPLWNIPLPHEVELWADNQLPQEPFIVISPGASKAERNWLAARYAKVADYCHSKGYKVVMTGGPSSMERELGDSILSHSKSPIVDLIGQTNLKQLLAALKAAQCVIAPDSGPAHMAVTQGTPVIGLYAHSNPRRTGPYLYLDYVADAYTKNATQQLNCSVEELPWGYRLKGDNLMQQISVEQVTQLIEQALQNGLDKNIIDQDRDQ